MTDTQPDPAAQLASRRNELITAANRAVNRNNPDGADTALRDLKALASDSSEYPRGLSKAARALYRKL